MNQSPWTLSNALSISRLVFCVPAVLYMLSPLPDARPWAAFWLCVAAATDFFDGYAARKLHQVTELGKVLDPIADKIGVGIIVLVLTWTGDLPLWFTAAVIVRDLLILVGGIMIRNQKRIIPQSNMTGKIAVTLIAVVALLAVLRMDSLKTAYDIALWSSVALMALSLYQYAGRLFIGRNSGTKG